LEYEKMLINLHNVDASSKDVKTDLYDFSRHMFV